MLDFGLQFALVLGLLLLSVRPLGGYMARVFQGEPTPGGAVLRPVERWIYRACGVRADQEQGWLEYAAAFLAFHLAGMVCLYALLRAQFYLPGNPAGLAGLSPALALSTAVSFATNTSWESYGGETTLSNLSQMMGIGVQSFLSAASGLAVAIALVRGLARNGASGIGNFWVDVTRALLYVLLPICIVAGLVFAWQGAPQTMAATVHATTLEGAAQAISVGPVASQEAIKLLSADGGGFFNAQSAHPFETPTVLANWLAMLLIPLLGAALTNSFGRMVGDERQGWALLIVMLVLLGVGAVVMYLAEAAPLLTAAGIDHHLGHLEGKEVRFGVAGSALFSEFGTATSSGAVNSMLGSYAPLGVLVAMANMMLGEVIIGGPGSGLFGMLLFALLAVFLGGLMVGRTPDYLGNRIEAREIKLVMLATVAPSAAALLLTAVACVISAGTSALGNDGPHGFSEILYAYVSAVNTNGSAMAGLSANTSFWNLTLALAMAIGRYFVVVAVLAIAGSLVTRRRAPPSAGTLPTVGAVWIGLLLGVILVVGGLTFLPALALGPLAEMFG